MTISYNWGFISHNRNFIASYLHFISHNVNSYFFIVTYNYIFFFSFEVDMLL